MRDKTYEHVLNKMRELEDNKEKHTKEEFDKLMNTLELAILDLDEREVKRLDNKYKNILN